VSLAWICYLCVIKARYEALKVANLRLILAQIRIDVVANIAMQKLSTPKSSAG